MSCTSVVSRSTYIADIQQRLIIRQQGNCVRKLYSPISGSPNKMLNMCVKRVALLSNIWFNRIKSLPLQRQILLAFHKNSIPSGTLINCRYMKVLRNKTLDFATAVQASVFNGNRAARTGYVRLVRLITDEPVPQQTSYTGKIELR